VATPYATSGWIAYSSPPTLGPAIVPTCHAIELIAIAVGSTARGTRFGANAEYAGPEKARATPNATAATNSTPSVRWPVHVSNHNVAAVSTSNVVVPRTIQRRSKLSAMRPVIGVSRNNGTNCANPIMPSMKAAWRMSIVSRAIL